MPPGPCMRAVRRHGCQDPALATQCCSTGNVGLRALGAGAPTHTFGVLTRRSSHTPCVGSLFFAVSVTPGVISSRSSHTPCVGSLFFVVSVTPGVVSLQSSHMPCVGLLFVLVVGGRSAGSRVDRGRSVERDN